MQECINYALSNNISIKKAQINTLSAHEDVLQSKAALLPSIDASTSQNIGYTPFQENGRASVANGYVENSINDYENARLNYQQAQQQVASANENIASAQQQVASAQESVKQAQTNLSYATITSPIDGIVLSKSVEEGQTVAASFNTPELFTIAQDLTNMQVVANVDEADIGDVKPGERVTFTVDAYPDDTFSGTVKQVRQEATTTNNVVTYEVVISAPNSDLKLKPGLTANVTIYTAERQGVLSVPSKAFRFNPTQDLVGGYHIIDKPNAKNKVWVIDGKNIKAIPVVTGMSDGTKTQIISGISEGATVITGIQEAISDEDGPEAQEGKEESPFGPKRPDKDRKKNGNGNTGKA